MQGLDDATTVGVAGPVALAGAIRVPGDKSISHRALLFAGLAEGESTVRGLSRGDDVRRTRQALAEFGVRFTDEDGYLRVLGGLREEPSTVLDLGNSGTAMRLIAGVCAGQDMHTVLTGDRFLRARPMDRVAVPLRSMGATVDGRQGGRLAPLSIRGGNLSGIHYASPVASAQVKSAVMLAGLSAAGSTTVVEPVATRRHTEEMLALFGVDVEVDGTAVTVRRSTLTPAEVDVQGDPSQAAFWAVGALIAPDSRVRVDNLYSGHGRTGFVDVLRRMGGRLDFDRTTGTLEITSGPLTAVSIGAEDVPGIVDEIPVLAVAAAAAEGTTVISGAEELRVKESDRIKSTVAMLCAFGVHAEETPDGMVIEGTANRRGGEVHSHGDHRIAMAAAVSGLAATGPTVIHGWDAVATSYPGFADHVAELSGGAARLREVTS
ncbi:3-phosphoshikimate 1-carboxyvinyltransferase [Actinophytocola xanthii]|uniref:3-phosphoshikimate 1-carboxyvinyltransferase n=1 Tax=Actinophytocola xanthii TaxID=1912961 RepID=UPI000A5F3B96|nr:3-phosphoshikimate 1-carboxyvinyltransferase [Actinophytocola xanthii]